MKRSAFGLALAVVMLGSGAARAASWDVIGGQTVGQGASVLHTQLGWPGISATFLQGVTDRFDAGARFSFNYGFEGQTGVAVVPGLKLQGVFRLMLSETDRVAFGLNFSPGGFVYFAPRTALFGLTFPIGLAMGIKASDAVTVALSFDIPMTIMFAGTANFALPILFGAGAEYKIDSGLSLTFDSRFGPYINATFGTTTFALQMLMGVAIKL